MLIPKTTLSLLIWYGVLIFALSPILHHRFPSAIPETLFPPSFTPIVFIKIYINIFHIIFFYLLIKKKKIKIFFRKVQPNKFIKKYFLGKFNPLNKFKFGLVYYSLLYFNLNIFLIN